MICPTGSHKPTNTIVLGFIRALLLKARVFGADSRVFLTFDPEERLYAAPTWLRIHICVYVFTTCRPRGSRVVTLQYMEAYVFNYVAKEVQRWRHLGLIKELGFFL